MKPFRFRLEKVLTWRLKELELEQFRMRELAAALESTEQKRARLEAERLAAQQALQLSRTTPAEELAAYDAFLVRLRKLDQQLLELRRRQQQELDRQRKRVLEAQRRCRLLERLKERRRREWEIEVNRELENFAAEAHLFRWSREGG